MRKENLLVNWSHFLLYSGSYWNHPTSYSANSIFDHRLFLSIKRRAESSSLDLDPEFLSEIRFKV